MKPEKNAPPALPLLPIIAAFGDSLVEGWGLDRSDALPAQIEAALERAGKSIRVLNFGFSGETAPEGLEHLPEVLAARPAVVLMEFGANDCYQGIPVEETEAALSAMAEGLLAAGCKVLLAGWKTTEDLFTRYADDPDLAGMLPVAPPLYNADYVRRFNQLHPELAKRLNIPLIPHFLDPLGEDGRYYQADAVHPNLLGSQVLAEALVPLLLPLLPTA
jgi:Lysophospholipase L1 and related esterases